MVFDSGSMMFTSYEIGKPAIYKQQYSFCKPNNNGLQFALNITKERLYAKLQGVKEQMR